MRLSLKILLAVLSVILLLAVAGYGFLRSLAPDLLRVNAEEQLSILLRGPTTIDEVHIDLRSGFRVVGSGVEVYPSEDGSGLSAGTVSARIGIVPLLAGRFRLHSLVVEDFRIEIRRTLSDEFSPSVIADVLAEDESSQAPGDLEDQLRGLQAIEEITRLLLTDSFIARKLELRHGSIRFVDAYSAGPGCPALDLRIQDINGKLHEALLGQKLSLELRGTWVDAHGTDASIEILGNRSEDGIQTLDVSVGHLEIRPLRSYLRSREPLLRMWRAGGMIPETPEEPLKGLLDGHLHYETQRIGQGQMTLNWRAKDFDAGLAWGNEYLRLDSPEAELHLVLGLDDSYVFLERMNFKGQDLQIEMSGRIERPLVDSSPADLKVTFMGVGLPEIRRIAAAQSPELRSSMVSTLDQIERGTIESIGFKGLAPIEIWLSVLAGDRLALPEGLALSATVSGVNLKQQAPGEGGSDLAGKLIWVEDQLRIVDITGIWNDRPLPTLSLVIDGFPLLLDPEVSFDPTRQRGGPLPGLFLLDDIFASHDDEEPDDAGDEAKNASPLDIQLEIELLDHPLLRWPMHDASLHIVSSQAGVEVEVERGIWGSGQVRGSLVWMGGESNRVDAFITIEAREPEWMPASEPVARGIETDDPLPSDWARGRFRVSGLPSDSTPFSEIAGRFRFSETQMSVVVNQSPLAPRGRLDGTLVFDLAHDDFIDAALDLKGRDSDAGPVTHFFRFPKGFATGDLDLDASLTGVLRPDSELFAEVDGKISVWARHGELRQNIPLVAGVVHASEGLDPVDASQAITYETIEAKFHFDQGRLVSDEFKLDGPLRIFMSGDFDVARPGKAINAEIGVFLFRQVDQLLGRVPLIKRLIPGGSEKGLFGAYFEIRGTIGEPELSPLAIKSLVEGLPVPDLVKAPFSAIHRALSSKPGARERARLESEQEAAEATQ